VVSVKDDFMLVARKVNKTVYREFKKKAVEKNVNVGRALVEAMELWIEDEHAAKKPDIKNLYKIAGSIKTKGPVKWSTEVDEILYGWKK
jgi:hypothetical protein